MQQYALVHKTTGQVARYSEAESGSYPVFPGPIEEKTANYLNSPCLWLQSVADSNMLVFCGKYRSWRRNHNNELNDYEIVIQETLNHKLDQAHIDHLNTFIN